ncbi:MAG: DUF4166 domain-containing protein [Pseudomonadota bacterium]
MNDHPASSEPLVERWFGPAFALLHPQLQALHRNGGMLRGPVQLSFGAGLAGAVGRALARRLGMPDGAASVQLEVTIHGDADGLHWRRRFNDGPVFDSLFRPVGHFPDGHWIERSGMIALALQVAVCDGGWHWRQRRLWLAGVPLPAWLMPRTIARKDVLDGRYLFSVEIAFPLLGKVLAYRGALQ